MAFVAVKAPGTGVMATPPATQLKRKRVEPESSGTNERNTFSESLSSPTKRLKVSFNPEIDVRLVEDWNEKSIGLVREEVIRAIHGHITGEGSTAYDQIIQLFKRKISAGDPPTSRLLRKYLIALTGQIRSLNRKCNGLVRAVVECQWLDRGDDFVKTYVRFLGTLVSAHGGYIYEVLSTLVKQFTSRKCIALSSEMTIF